MSANASDGDGAYAEFSDHEAARRAVQRLEAKGVDASRILLDTHAPDQSAAPVDTAERDKKVIKNISRLWATGAVAGLVVGAVIGALAGMLIWGPDQGTWILLAVGAGVFGVGLGTLWALMIGKGESTHSGTVMDRPGTDKRPTIVVRPDEPQELDELLAELSAAGGHNVGRVGKNVDAPER